MPECYICQAIGDHDGEPCPTGIKRWQIDRLRELHPAFLAQASVARAFAYIEPATPRDPTVKTHDWREEDMGG